MVEREPNILRTQRYKFSAAHRLRAEKLSPEENWALYGKCAHASGHGHDYVLEVTVRADIDPTTGLSGAAIRLDRAVAEVIFPDFDHRQLDREVSELTEQPSTGENIGRVIFARLSKYFPAGELIQVRVRETRNNIFTFGERST